MAKKFHMIPVSKETHEKIRNRAFFNKKSMNAVIEELLQKEEINA